MQLWLYVDFTKYRRQEQPQNELVIRIQPNEAIYYKASLAAGMPFPKIRTDDIMAYHGSCGYLLQWGMAQNPRIVHDCYQFIW